MINMKATHMTLYLILALMLPWQSLVTSQGAGNGVPVTINTFGSCAGVDNILDVRIKSLEDQIIKMTELMDKANSLMTNRNITRDCSDIYKEGQTKSGVYTIHPENSPGPIEVYCLFDIEGHWTVFQQRTDDSVDFKRSWTEYKKGFGILGTNHWLGNENIHLITSQRQYKLRIDLVDFTEAHRYAEYRYFTLDGEDNKYAIRYANHSGTAGDALSDYHRGMNFSTFDQDNDKSVNENCAERHGGGWWYNACDHSNLNGNYHRDPALSGPYDGGIEWDSWKALYSFKSTMMRLKPAFLN